MTNKQLMKKIKKWEKFISSLAYRFSTSIADIDDAKQEAICEILSILSKYKGNIDDLDNYIAAVAKNAILRQCNATKFVVSIATKYAAQMNNDELFEITKNVNPEFDVVVGNDDFEMIDFLDLLEVFDEKNIAKMYFIEGRRVREIGKILKINHVEVVRTLRRISNAIKWEMKK